MRLTTALAGVLSLVAATSAVGQGPVDGAKVVADVGVVEGAPLEQFGWVSDAVFTADSVLIVLDSQAGTVTWFDIEAGTAAILARTGEGPGEVVRPHRAVLDDLGRLLVLDVGIGRLSTFVIDDGRPRFTSSRHLAVPVYDICSLDGNLYALLTRASGVVARIGEDGAVMESFGESAWGQVETKVPFPTYDQRLDQGYIACDMSTRRVIVVNLLFGVVKAFGVDGALSWSVTLPDFQGVSLEAVPGGGCCIYMPPEGSKKTDQATGVVVLGEEVVVSVSTIGDAADIQGIRYHFLAIEDGSDRGVVRADLSLVDRTAAFAVGIGLSPVPRVVVLQVDSGHR